jgi:hypothetical protein
MEARVLAVGLVEAGKISERLTKLQSQLDGTSKRKR